MNIDFLPNDTLKTNIEAGDVIVAKNGNYLVTKYMDKFYLTQLHNFATFSDIHSYANNDVIK